jgi:hypothetical protein
MWGNRYFASTYWGDRYWGQGTGDVVEPPVVDVIQGGGGGRKRKPFKSWDQRQRERLEAIQKANEEKYGILPKTMVEALKPAPSPYKRLSPEKVAAYQNAVHSARQDDEAAMNLIMSLI